MGEISIFWYLLLGLLIFRFVWFFLALFFTRTTYSKPYTQAEALPPVSVVLAAHNELLNLKELLPLLLTQDYPDFEVIVVDDRSWDDSYEYLYRQHAEDPRLRVVRIEQTPEHITHKKFALTMGIKAAKHDIVLLTDADCRPASKNWIRHMAAPFMQQRVQIVLGASLYTSMRGILNALIRFETLYTLLLYVTAARIGIPYMGVGRNLAYRRSFFLQNKGFNIHQRLLGGDDDLLVNRLARATNTKVCLHPEALTWSIPKRTWREWIRQKRRHLSVGKYYRVGHRLMLVWLWLSHVVYWGVWVYLFMQGWHVVQQKLLILLSALNLCIFSLHMLAVSLLARRLRTRLSIIALPFLELFYLLYIGVIGLWALLTKVEKWN